tara:strand:- start:2344 stop:3237 length:894 start_codon:yes stop_codon:yes gene_type:complete
MNIDKRRVVQATSNHLPYKYHIKREIEAPEHNSKVSLFINVAGKYHKKRERLTFSFLDGTQSQHEHVRAGVDKILAAVPGLDLVEDDKQTDIRIRFNPRLGAWSYVGTDIFKVPPEEPTMNLGWLEPTHRVVVHEFLHALNMSHEHLRGVNWDVEKTYAYFSRFGWSEEDVNHNLLDFNDQDHDVSNEIDLKSIMLYPIPCELTKDGLNCGRSNTKMSDLDIKRLNEMFPIAKNTEIAETVEDAKPFLKKLFKSKKTLLKLREVELILIADELGISAKVEDLKSDTADKILKTLKSN